VTTAPDVAPRYFTSRVIDDSPALLEASYSLRYQVYCLERGFLPVEDYPDEREVDDFDPHSVHFGVLNLQGEVVATARLVQHSEAGLPLFQHCSLFPDAPPLDGDTRNVVEVSRLAVSRKYNRRAGDDFYSLQGRIDPNDRRRRREGGEIVMALYKALYQASKRRGFTHWLAATEKSLQRLVARYGFPFVAIGPQTDYYGAVCPYLMDLDEFDRIILSRRISLLDDFLEGLEGEFTPVEGYAR
jgi:N-acyl amino acid synthase of PEP-CTERM/exosortase system